MCFLRLPSPSAPPPPCNGSTTRLQTPPAPWSSPLGHDHLDDHGVDVDHHDVSVMIVITQGSSFMIIRIIHISDDLDLDDEVDHDHVDKDDDGNHLHLRELADRLLPATKQLGTKVTLTSCNCNCENLKINHCSLL